MAHARGVGPAHAGTAHVRSAGVGPRPRPVAARAARLRGAGPAWPQLGGAWRTVRRGCSATGDGSMPAHGTAGRRRLTGEESATGDGGRDEAAAAARPAAVRATRLGQRRSGRQLSGGGTTRSGNGRRERGCGWAERASAVRLSAARREVCCRDAAPSRQRFNPRGRQGM
jgi:hypothetical protein